MTASLRKYKNLGLSGWLGRRWVGDPWHRMHDGGSHTLCGIADTFSVGGGEMRNTFRNPDEVPIRSRCSPCEGILLAEQAARDGAMAKAKKQGDAIRAARRG